MRTLMQPQTRERAGGRPTLAEAAPEFTSDHVGGWDVRRYGAVASTEEIAASLPPWTAVVAESQSAGRGQWKRPFVSDRGGFYLTAVLPFEGDGAQWRGFALAVGWAVVTRFQSRSIAGMRLRWPNDLMIGAKKVGGLLVSQAGPERLCVGLGLNVTNQPWLEDSSLQSTACRLADFAEEDHLGTDFLEKALLGAIRTAHSSFSQRGLGGFVGALNQSWGDARHVRLEMESGSPQPEIQGRFDGILQNGDLLLEDAKGRPIVVRSHLVRRLHEC